MPGLEITARDARVVAILLSPDEYFAAASRRAFTEAENDIVADLARRAAARRNGSGLAAANR